MAKRLMGLETEYAVAALGADGRCSAANGCKAMMRSARQSLAHIPGFRKNTMFLQNGGLIYPDENSHPEYASPEVIHPDDSGSSTTVPPM